ncbi:DUF6328 family protein [Arthrobacter sp. 35W]|uniref:DUF6328 family protein n=1 Tax=Arthrobacter sp. 35W TaxID=1132441 RepID=UPI002F2B5A06
MDRNWGDLLQELRVMQTGTQIIAGFLLTLPFQQRFATLDDFQKWGPFWPLSCWRRWPRPSC